MIPTFTSTIASFYNSSGTFSTQVAHLGGTLWFYNNFSSIILGVILITAVILFAKYKFGNQQQQQGSVYR
jgi:hypothetical protein